MAVASIVDTLGLEGVLESHIVHGITLHVAVGSVVTFTGDAIVNAANEGCISGGGVDGAITDAGGDGLHDARLALPIVEGTRAVRCPTGRAVITTAGSLRCRFVIHAVGPNYHAVGQDEEGDALLRSAYASSLELAAEQTGIHTLAFSLLSSGIFRGQRPLAAVLRVGLSGLRDASAALGVAPGKKLDLADIFLVAYTSDEKRELLEAARTVFGEGAARPTQLGEKGADA